MYRVADKRIYGCLIEMKLKIESYNKKNWLLMFETPFVFLIFSQKERVLLRKRTRSFFLTLKPPNQKKKKYIIKIL
jgi:hypothetical protein